MMSWAEEMGYDAYDASFRNDYDGSWTTKDGHVMSISEMTDNHLLNAYRKFNDEHLLREMILRLFEAKVRGES